MTALEVALHWSAVPLIAGAAALSIAIIRLSMRPMIGIAVSPGEGVLLILAAALLLLALPAVYIVQAGTGGTVALAGHALLSIGLLLLVVVGAPPVLTTRAESTFEHPLLFALGIAFTLGLLLTGVSAYQANVVPRPAALLLLAATAGFFFQFFVAEVLPPRAGQVGATVLAVLLGGALGWIGVWLWNGPLPSH
jgi:hypothetical protein